MYDLLPRRIKVLIFVEMPSSVRCQFLYGKDMGGIDFAACRRKIEANSTLVRTVIRGLQKKGYKKTPQENSYGVWDRKKALILSYQRLFFRRYLILNLTPRSLPPKNIVLPTNSMFSYAEAGKVCVLLMLISGLDERLSALARFVGIFLSKGKEKYCVVAIELATSNSPPDCCI